MLATLTETSLNIPMGWALTGFLSLCGLVAGMGKLLWCLIYMIVPLPFGL